MVPAKVGPQTPTIVQVRFVICPAHLPILPSRFAPDHGRTILGGVLGQGFVDDLLQRNALIERQDLQITFQVRRDAGM